MVDGGLKVNDHNRGPFTLHTTSITRYRKVKKDPLRPLKIGVLPHSHLGVVVDDGDHKPGSL